MNGARAALKTNSDLLDKNQQHILKLEKQLLARLDESGVVYRCNCGESKLPGLLSLSFPDKDGDEYSGRFWTAIPGTQYRDSSMMDTAVPVNEYRKSG